MEFADLLVLIVRLSVGAIMTFFAILLWSNTRDTAWMFLVMGTILQYGEIMYTTFQAFGILHGETVVFGIPVVRILLINLPAVFFTIGFIIAVSKARSR